MSEQRRSLLRYVFFLNSSVALALMSLLLVACKPAPAPQVEQPMEVMPRSQAELALEELLVQQQGERLRRVSASSRVFQDAIQGLLGDPQEERLSTAQQAWSQLYLSFNEAVVLLACRAAQSPELAQLLQRADSFPVLLGYIDSLQQWPDGGIVNDVSLPLTRESLLGQQGVSAQEEISLGFQAIGFLLYGEPDSARTVLALTEVLEVPEGSPFSLLEQPENRRRVYLQLASDLLVEDLLALATTRETANAGSVNTDQLAVIGAQCPVDALRRTTERMIRVTGLEDRQVVSAEYYAADARTIALAGLQQALQPWLAEDSVLRPWLAENGVQATLPLLPAKPNILQLQQLHAALSAGRSQL